MTPEASARAAFILREARRLDIRVGTDGEDLLIWTPRGLPSPVYTSFRDALLDLREAVIACILVENERRR